MSGQQWYLYLLGETLGPLTTEAVVSMLRQNRVQFAEWAWRDGLTKWTRISDLDEFTAQMPPYPKVSIPGRAAGAPAPAPAPAAAPVAEARKPEPKAPDPKAAAEKAKAEEQAKWEKIRRYQRIPVEGKAEIQGQGSFRVINLSEGGMYVATPNRLAVGTEIKFKLEAPDLDKALEMTGVVIRGGDSDGEPGFAVEFLRVNPAHKRSLAEFAKKRASKP